MRGFVVWQPIENGVKYLLPKIPNVAPTELAQRYTKAVKSSAVYRKMTGTQDLQLSASPESFSEFPTSTAEHPNVAVVVNRPAQMLASSPFLPKAVEAFQSEGPRLFAIPIGLETVLSPKEMRQFRKKLNKLDGQLGMGGDDVHPLLYDQKDLTRARGDLSVKRDREIIAYFREYLRHGKGRVFYICGAMQRAAVMEGSALHDDIGQLTQGEHMNTDEKLAVVEVVAEEGSELEAAAGASRFLTSNAHHAAVNPDVVYSSEKTPQFRVSAYNIEPDGVRGQVVKAIDFAENAGFATQFHPELGSFPEERRIIQYVATGWKLRARVSPSVILECMNLELENRLSTD